jgi:hypothetical protein
LQFDVTDTGIGIITYLHHLMHQESLAIKSTYFLNPSVKLTPLFLEDTKVLDWDSPFARNCLKEWAGKFGSTALSALAAPSLLQSTCKESPRATNQFPQHLDEVSLW